MTTERTKLYSNHNNQCVAEAPNPVTSLTKQAPPSALKPGNHGKPRLIQSLNHKPRVLGEYKADMALCPVK
jgi:hypothetical protein